jgi:pimeloyl-ACP methyl ester carboxylesterase
MREIWFDAAGVRLFALEDGSGPPVVMLHGGMANHRAARPLVAPLASRYRVVTPDLRASGRSLYGGTLTFDQLADDLAMLLDHLGEARAVVGGVSSGSGVAVRFALRHLGRTAGLIVASPMYAGSHLGYTEAQERAFTEMDAVASRAVEEGVQVLRPLYAKLPEPVRSKALEMIEGFDPASVVATSRFIASGSQPFETPEDLRSVAVPALLVRGEDAQHPAEVSDLHAEHLPDCRVLPAATRDVAAAIGAFCDEVF